MNAATEAQAAVDSFFDRDAIHWQAIYDQADIFSVIHQRRQRIALEWIRGLDLPRGGAVLEVGCGAGLLAVALARDGLDVTATDSTDAMLDLAGVNAAKSGVAVRLEKLDVHHLDVGAGEFELVVALGVIPWLHSPDVALAEISRAVRPGGHVVINADNRYRLQSWIDPLFSPPLAPLRHAARTVAWRRREPHAEMPSTVRHSRRAFDAALGRAGLTKVRGKCFGFGPFTLLGRRVLDDRTSLALDRRLQSAADRGAPILGATGAQYIVLARRDGASA